MPLLCLKQNPEANFEKGKMVPTKNHRSHACSLVHIRAADPYLRWSRPAAGWNKLNTDGAYKEDEGIGGAGMILRNSEGHIIFASCRFLHTCSSALEAEVSACAEGIALALEWSTEPFTIESDCSVAVNMLSDGTPNRSPVTALVEEGKLLLKSGRDHSISHARRSQNRVAHALA